MTKNKKNIQSVTNQFGATLREVQQVSRSLDDLLSNKRSSTYNNKLNADMGTVAYLRYWQFDERSICDILSHYRSRGRDETTINQIVRETTLTDISPICSSIGCALIESSKNNDGRPKVGVETLREIQLVFNFLGNKTTTSKIVESGFPEGNAKKKSVKRRVQRGLNILEQAGYVSHKEVGQLYIWYNEELSSLCLPEYRKKTL